MINYISPAEFIYLNEIDKCIPFSILTSKEKKQIENIHELQQRFLIVLLRRKTMIQEANIHNTFEEDKLLEQINDIKKSKTSILSKLLKLAT